MTVIFEWSLISRNIVSFKAKRRIILHSLCFYALSLTRIIFKLIELEIEVLRRISKRQILPINM